jgi:capsular exopolysaccharide synthesis family protein
MTRTDEDGTRRRGRSPDGRALEGRLVSLVAPDSFEAEQYLALRYVLEQRRRSQAMAVIAVTSAVAGEGKTTTAINLAGAVSRDPEARVLLVDADLRLSSMGDQLGLGQPARGLVDAISNHGLLLGHVVRRLPSMNLSVLAAGRCPEAPYELLKSPRLGALLEEARRCFDTVVVDTPPLIPVPDSRVLAKWVDGFLLVVAAHKTPRRLLEESLDLLEPDKVVGVVFNGDDRPFSGYYGRYYGYGRARDAGREGWWDRPARRQAGAP